MSTTVMTDAGRVNWISSYRNSVAWMQGNRRFNTGTVLEGDTYRTYCQNETDAGAVSAWYEADRAAFVRWVSGKDFEATCPPREVLVDPVRWEELVYPPR